jgi:DNA integrity scanning protein DisA with diadenylate cyclase activity
MILVEGALDWGRLKKAAPDAKFIVAVTKQELLMGAETAGFKAFSIEEKEIYAEEDQEHSKKELLQRAVHELAIKRIVPSGANLVLLYSCFNPTVIDSISLVTLDEHQEKLDWQKLRKLDTNISPKTIRTVVELAMSIGREGREGKKVGTMFVVGDTKRVMKNSRPIGFDPVRGYTCRERDLACPAVREGIKEIAQLDGAFVISRDGVVRAACRMIDAPTAKVALSKGFGTRHWAGAAISKITDALAVVVSQTNGSVRIFQKGISVLLIETQSSNLTIWREHEKEEPMFDYSSN